MRHEFWSIIPPEMIFDRDLKRIDLWVYAAIAARSNGKKHMWAMNKTIGEDISASDKTVSRSISRLAGKDYLKIEADSSMRVVYIVTPSVETVTPSVEMDKPGLSKRTPGVVETDTHKKIKEEVKVKKNIYGEFRHVKLSDDQYGKLVNDWGIDELNFRIRELDEYMEKHGKKYKNHLLALRTFKRNNFRTGYKENRPHQLSANQPKRGIVHDSRCRICKKEHRDTIDNVCVNGCDSNE